MSRYINRRSVLTLALLLILGTFLPPLINVSRFRVRVADALSRALGRPVSIGEVHLRLVPRPGLDLDRLIVQDDPAFSAEPLLRAGQVTASLRLTSLWRGRLEIASLSLSYPSLNLVRSPNGHWNLESLLERARQIPTAPTGKRTAGARPRFPYIEARGGRINLKLGQEKTVYALSDAEFTLSLPSENIWQLNLSARPLRTDANLSDTGSVRVSGTIQRGDTLTDTPLDLRLGLNGAQLGQLTTLIYGRDRGWRGSVNISATVKGTPAALKLDADSSVDDFRRYDIATPGSLRLRAHCAAGFSTQTQQLSDIVCRAPIAGGLLELHGAVTGVLPVRGYALSASATNLPASSLVALAQRMKRDLPDDLQASGTVDGAFDVKIGDSGTLWAGSGATSKLTLTSRALTTPLKVGDLELLWGSPVTHGKRKSGSAPANTVLRVSPFSVDLDAPAPAKAQAWFAPDAYSLDLQGDARVNRLLEVAHALGVRAPALTVTGLATSDLHVAGNWTRFAAPVVTGNLHLHSVTATIPGIAAPLQVSTAAVHLAPDAVAIYDLAGIFTGTHLAFTGSAQAPRTCAAGPCPIVFQARADQLSTDELNRLLNPRVQKRPWYDIIGARPQPSGLVKVAAVGKISAARVEVKTLLAKRVSGDVRLDSGLLTVRNLHADVLGGSTTAELHADFTGAEPTYSINGALQHASMAAIAAITRDVWATGRIGATYRVTAAGWDASHLRSSATGSVIFDWQDGTLPHLALNGGPAPLKIGRFQGELTLSEGELAFKPSRMETPGGIYQVSGTASLDRQLDLKLMRGKSESYGIGGTLEKPRVTPAPPPETQRAAVKP